MEHTFSGIPKGRRDLAQLVAHSGDVIQVQDAVRVLSVERSVAAKTLARWTTQGFLRRVRRGVYLPATLDSLNSEYVLDDPWILVPGLFASAYVGGRTAASYWDLTEQLFNDVVVFTTQSIRRQTDRWHGMNFTIKHIHTRNMFGYQPVWRGRTKVLVSDLQRTVIDMLDDPAFSGGIHHVADCFSVYLRRADRVDSLLIEYAERLGNGALFKRLGLLAEQHGETDLALACRERMTQGTIKLDHSLACPKLITRWRLWVPADWKLEPRP